MLIGRILVGTTFYDEIHVATLCHLATILMFFDGDMQHLPVHVVSPRMSLQLTGGQLMVFRGQKTLEEVPEVMPGQVSRPRPQGEAGEAPPLKRAAVASAVPTLPRPVAVLPR
eukprot:EG_transcript_16329